jgi:aspartyl-tRNA(Asn)/glutamyl-tRNA(Gln) amidotransferase subunit A
VTITGSIAAASFRDAVDLLLRSERIGARSRVPFDYATVLAPQSAPFWVPPRRLLPADAGGPIVDAFNALRARTRSARELVEESIANIAAADALGGITEHCEGAVRRADALDAELTAGLDRGPLHGVPITVKDVIDIAGVPTRAGSDAYEQIPGTSALAVERLEAAGAIVVAKASTHEFALGVTSPQSRNPHDPTRIPGGSSGGSAVCVVTRAGLGSLGTDTRASIRVPAALSGVVGFKPTYGRIPTKGVLSLAWTMDHVAPMAATVTDAALMLDALFGGTSELAWTPRRGLDGLRVGVVDAAFDDVRPGIAELVEDACSALARLGCSMRHATTPSATDLELANAAGLVISRCEAACAHRGLHLDRSLYWEEVRDQLDAADAISAVDYLDAQRIRAELRDRLLGVFAEFDLLVMPTVPVVAPRVDAFAEYLMLLARNAIPWSLVGPPAVSVPVGRVDGLPVGLQLVAAPHAEARLVEAARAVEQR